MTGRLDLRQTSQRTVADRAAHYFGVQTEPRTSISTGRNSCYVVCERMGRAALMWYSEEYREPRGSYTLLTEAAREELIVALEGVG